MMKNECFTPVASSRAQLWEYQPDKKTYSWEASIESARDEIGQLLRRSPSLKSQLEEALSIAWRRARLVPKWGLDKRGWESKFPTDCEWSLKDVLDNDFWPNQSIAGQW